MAGPSLIALAAAAVLVGAGAPSAGTAGPPAVVRVTTLGTNGGAILNKGRAQPANLLEVDGKAYLIDAGAGTLRQLAQVGVSPMRIDQIFITHNHIDHNADWPLLMAHAYVVGRRTPMTVLGPGGFAMMDGGMAHQFTCRGRDGCVMFITFDGAYDIKWGRRP